MEGSMISSPNKSGVSEPTQRRSSTHLDPEEEVEETDDEESSWTQILADFSDLRREEEAEEMSLSSGSMVSDAGSGPEWKPRNYPNKNTMPMKKLNFNKSKKESYSYDESLEDTASSPANSPKIAMGFKGMDINCKSPDENFEIYHGKGRAINVAGRHDQAINQTASAVDGQDKVKFGEEMGYCLVPVAMIMNFHDYYY